MFVKVRLITNADLARTASVAQVCHQVTEYARKFIGDRWKPRTATRKISMLSKILSTQKNQHDCVTPVQIATQNNILDMLTHTSLPKFLKSITARVTAASIMYIFQEAVIEQYVCDHILVQHISLLRNRFKVLLSRFRAESFDQSRRSVAEERVQFLQQDVSVTDHVRLIQGAILQNPAFRPFKPFFERCMSAIAASEIMASHSEQVTSCNHTAFYYVYCM